MYEWSSVYDHNNWGYSRSRYELGNKRVIMTHTVWDHLLLLWLTVVNCSWFTDWITCERVTMAGSGQGMGRRWTLWGQWCDGTWPLHAGLLLLHVVCSALCYRHRSLTFVVLSVTWMCRGVSLAWNVGSWLGGNRVRAAPRGVSVAVLRLIAAWGR